MHRCGLPKFTAGTRWRLGQSGAVDICQPGIAAVAPQSTLLPEFHLD
jgi:hypothetical protein